MEIGNTVEISDQNFYLGVVFIKSGDELPDPKFRLMTHIRRYGGLEINFKKILFFWNLFPDPHIGEYGSWGGISGRVACLRS